MGTMWLKTSHVRGFRMLYAMLCYAILYLLDYSFSLYFHIYLYALLSLCFAILQVFKLCHLSQLTNAVTFLVTILADRTGRVLT